MADVEDLLSPGEKLVLRIADQQASRGEAPTENIATMCTLALLRITGKFDYTKEDSDGATDRAGVH